MCGGDIISYFQTFPQKDSASSALEKLKEKPTQPEIKNHLLRLIQNRYLVLMSAITMMAIFGKFFVDFAFLSQVQARYADAVQLAGFFALFSCVTQILDFAGRTTLSGTFFHRYGIRIGLITLPAFHTICTLLIVLTGTLFSRWGLLFGLTIINQGLYKVFRKSIDRPSFKVLYQHCARNNA